MSRGYISGGRAFYLKFDYIFLIILLSKLLVSLSFHYYIFAKIYHIFIVNLSHRFLSTSRLHHSSRLSLCFHCKTKGDFLRYGDSSNQAISAPKATIDLDEPLQKFEYILAIYCTLCFQEYSIFALTLRASGNLIVMVLVKYQQ
jgi:hypothetical protein